MSTAFNKSSNKPGSTPSSPTGNIIKRMKPLLGTFVEIGFCESDALSASDIFDQAFKSIVEIEQQMSFHNPLSALSRLNFTGTQPGQWIDLPSETLDVLQKAKMLSEKTNGLFNCTVGGYLVNRQKLPNHFVHDFLLSGQADDIEISDHQARLRRPVLITLDGIAKGYAVDQAIQTLQLNNVQSGYVNAGGDLRVFGSLQLPIYLRQITEQSQVVTPPSIALHNQAFASSQVIRKSVQPLPSHIIDSLGVEPEDGLICVQASKAWLADGLTKVLALLPESKRSAMADTFSTRYVSNN